MKEATGKDAIAARAPTGEEGRAAGDRQLSSELAEMEAQTRSKAWKVVQDRFQENLAQPAEAAASRS